MVRRTALQGMGQRRTRRRASPVPVVRGDVGDDLDFSSVDTLASAITLNPAHGNLVSLDDSYGYLRGMGSQVTARAHRHGRFHVSDICTKCPRKLSLIYHFDQYHVSELLWPVSGVTFSIGDAIHDLVRRRFQHASPDKFFGDWTCSCAATINEGTWESQREICSTCGTYTDTYLEKVYTDEEHNLTAAIDMVRLDIVEDREVYTVGEIKSCAASIFDGLIQRDRPDPDHILQASFYHRMLVIQGYTVSDRISIIYVCKENRFGRAYKEFRVEPNTTQVNAELAAVKDILVNGVIPPKANNCIEFGAGDSKKCGCAALCFSIPETIEYFKDI